MSTIVVSPLSSTEVPAFEVVNLEIRVKDDDFVGMFDLIEVWRSRGTAGGPYEELTSDRWRPARLPKYGTDAPASPITGPTINIVGEVLAFKLKERDSIAIVFTGSDPLTYAQVATQIGAQSGGRLRAYVDSDIRMVIETLEPGTGAALRVLEGDAASFLALPMLEPESLAFGRDARIQLIPGQQAYRFSDISGSTTYFYKTRFRNRSTSAVSEFSLPFGVGQAVGISPTNLVCGYLDLVSNDGRPIVGREVSLHSHFVGELVEDKLIAGNDLVKRTDSDGHVEFTLVRGQSYTLAISGLDLAKEIVAPADVSVASFLLLDAEYGTQDDYFRVRVPNIPILERRGL